jgi:hypothetical protein
METRTPVTLERVGGRQHISKNRSRAPARTAQTVQGALSEGCSQSSRRHHHRLRRRQRLPNIGGLFVPAHVMNICVAVSHIHATITFRIGFSPHVWEEN